ncbi:hypothetical protein J7E38_18280 [Bacillus sp. ISL-35]|uniref:hypothetical protein n=1 Tax=Bacillus sp. ISL-35 TaxID=2819122 RepID=UPI001BEB6B4A|nr:hypothetical protein [Bacillus sp. ISL-35]MBT2680942.1 hypothetical protein [Bacillus sp. ISL-35]MBT2705259.1 hypothetical protein [Chryseobacterium sp. ISL-80]
MDEIVKKLRFKEGNALVLNAPDGFRLGVEGEQQSDKNDFLLLFVSNRDEIMTWLPKALEALKQDAVFWIAFPKKSSKVQTDIKRDSLFAIVSERSDYRAVSNVSIDQKWSALRFRQEHLVKTKK